MRHTVETLTRASGGCFAGVQFLIIESDSTGATLDELQRLQQGMPGFAFISLGARAEKLPARTRWCALDLMARWLVVQPCAHGSTIPLTRGRLLVMAARRRCRRATETC